MGIARHALLRESGNHAGKSTPAQICANRDSGRGDDGAKACFQRGNELLPLISSGDRAAIKNKIRIVGEGFADGAQPTFRLREQCGVDRYSS